MFASPMLEESGALVPPRCKTAGGQEWVPILSTTLQWHVLPSFLWRLTTTSISLHGLSTQFRTANVKTVKITGKIRACHLATRGQVCVGDKPLIFTANKAAGPAASAN